MIAISSDRPIDSGMSRKWWIVVIPEFPAREVEGIHRVTSCQTRGDDEPRRPAWNVDGAGDNPRT
jgi:hypothetical protein